MLPPPRVQPGDQTLRLGAGLRRHEAFPRDEAFWRDEGLRRIEGWMAAEQRQRAVSRLGDRLVVEERGGGRFEYVLNRAGDVACITEADGQSTRYAYDERRRLVSVERADTSSTRYTYSPDDRLTEVADRGVRRRFEYDSSGRLVRAYRGSAGAAVYRYDDAGRVVEARTALVSTRYEYDPSGRVTAIRQALDGVSLEARLVYDADGRLGQMALPGSASPIKYRWDERGRPQAVGLGDRELAHYVYDDPSRVTSAYLANGVVEQTWADPVDGRPTGRRVRSGERVLFERDYRYSPAGQVVADGRCRYEYDELGRLVEARSLEGAWADGAVWRFSYTPSGDRARIEHCLGAEAPEQACNYEYDANSRLVGVAGADGRVDIKYDGFGRPTYKTGPMGEWVYRFDDAGSLVQVRHQGQVVSDNTYDHKGRLVRAVTPIGTERYLYGPADELLAVTGDQGQPLRLIVRTPLGPLAEVYGPSEEAAELRVFFLHADHQGTVHLVTGLDGSVVGQCEYGPFGEPLGHSMGPAFHGRLWHPGIGLYYAGARWYDPHLGRFLTPDTYTGGPDDERLVNPLWSGAEQVAARAEILGDWLKRPRERHPYVYCANDPASRLDPNGHWSFGGVLLTLLGAIWTLPNTLLGLLIEITCLVGEVVRWLAWLLSAGHVTWETPGFDVAASGRLNAFALVFSGGWLGSFSHLLGITFGNVFFVYKNWEDNPEFSQAGDAHPPAYGGRVAIPWQKALYEHELRHTNQYGWFGPFFHLGLPIFGVYLWDVILHGYRNAWLERDARDHAEDPLPDESVSSAAPAPAPSTSLTSGAGPALAAVAAAAQPAPPVTPMLPPIVITRSVGRGGQNRVADVRLVQDRLLALRFLSQADYTAEAPAKDATGTVPANKLPATIAAIEALQREALGSASPDGQIGVRGKTIGAMNRVIPRPAAADYTAATTARAAITETVTRGMTITAPVGDAKPAAVTAGQVNRPPDVRAVQVRLVQFGYLSATHGESPAQGATDSIPAASLPLTRDALRRFQKRDVTFWRQRGEVHGAQTPGVVAQGDATQQLFDRIALYREAFTTGESITFRDHPASIYTIAANGTSYSGTQDPSGLGDAEYTAIGLTPAQTAALQFVSAHEGKFDALNTYDKARLSFGFIQFAGGRGLPPFMALLKARAPATFSAAFQAYGIDVEFGVVNGDIKDAQLVVLDPAASRVLRGAAAEGAVRDSSRLSAVFILAGSIVDVQRVQVEAAARDYVLNSLAARATLDADLVEELAAPGGPVTATHAGSGARAFRTTPAYGSLKSAKRIRERTSRTSARLDALLSSEQGLATLMDRAIQDGAGPGGGGTVRLTGAVLWVADQQGLADVAQVAQFEGQVLQQVVDDFGADIDIAQEIQSARTAVEALRTAAGASGATVAAILARAEAGQARDAADRALAIVPRKSFLPRRDKLSAGLTGERARLSFTPAPATMDALRKLLTSIANALSGLQPDSASEKLKRERIEDIRKSTLTAPT